MTVPLAGLSVLVTRPAHQAEALCEALSIRGARPLRLPTLAIEPVPLTDERVATLKRVTTADWVMFVSRNAVEQGLARLAEAGLALPEQARLAAVGPATTAALAEAGLTVALQPSEGFNSEALLAAPQWQDMRGREVLILRGDGGRELLAETLAARGARVGIVEVYRRRRPALDAGPVLREWAAAPRRAALATSPQGLTNLAAMAAEHGATAALRGGLLLTVSERSRADAERMGFERVRVAADPTDAGLIRTLEHAFRTDK